jgi:hypothetical protein
MNNRLYVIGISHKYFEEESFIIYLMTCIRVNALSLPYRAFELLEHLQWEDFSDRPPAWQRKDQPF